MDFTINFTLIIQAINFIVALTILNKLLLGPAIKLLLIEDRKTQKLKRFIVIDQDKLRKQKDAVLAAWQNLQQDLRSKQPSILQQKFTADINFVQENIIEDISIDKKAKEFSDIITQKFKN